jgi:hypothetical protein
VFLCVFVSVVLEQATLTRCVIDWISGMHSCLSARYVQVCEFAGGSMRRGKGTHAPKHAMLCTNDRKQTCICLPIAFPHRLQHTHWRYLWKTHMNTGVVTYKEPAPPEECPMAPVEVTPPAYDARWVLHAALRSCDPCVLSSISCTSACACACACA